MTNRRISSLRPETDETLMSFLRRAQVDAGYSDEGFNCLVAGTPLPDSRLAERREFDWQSLSRFFNASPEELHALSERSIFYEMGDGSCRGHFRQRAPWVQSVGYGAYCPASLRNAAHWRKSWLGPAALTCKQHQTVLVRHCHGCGEDLAAMVWKTPAPVCPTCVAHLALGPVIPAPANFQNHTEQISQRYELLMSKKPVDRHDYELAHFAVLWRAARILATKGRFILFRAKFARWAGLGNSVCGDSVAEKAIRHVQCVIMAHLICDMESTVVEHYWLLAEKRRDFAQADEAVLFKLTEFAENFFAQKLHGPVRCQSMMSFTSWVGSNGMPKAA